MYPEAAHPVPCAELVASLPPQWPGGDLTAAIEQHVQTSDTRIIVLDDDPTGTQTVHDVLVLTAWSPATLRVALKRDEKVIFILTNSRSYPLAEAQAMNREIAANLSVAARQEGHAIEVISRSDSTLRGHFPGEVEELRRGLEDGLGVRYDGCIIIPALFEAGRYTIGNIHWVREGEMLAPSGLTAYARDASFGYRSSDLRNWVEEKTQGQVSAESVLAVTLDDIRRGGPDHVAQALSALRDWGVAIVNLATYQDIAVLVAGLLKAEQQGKRFLFRTAASFVKVRGGITPEPLLTANHLFVGEPPQVGGLVVIGSYVPKSSEQAARLLALPGIVGLELRVERILSTRHRDGEIARVVDAMNHLLPTSDVVVMTSRQLKTGDSAEENLHIGQMVSAAVVEVVSGLNVRPRFIVAKGGVTSSDVATRALGIKQATVLGQIAPAVPVWRPAADSRFPDVPYVVFPGNVGGPETLAEVVQTLRARSTDPPSPETLPYGGEGNGSMEDT